MLRILFLLIHRHYFILKCTNTFNSTALVACTYQLNEKFAGMLWDNHNQQNNRTYHNHDQETYEEKEEYYGLLWGRGLLQIFSGKGIVHDEGHEIS